jgi:acyl-coenzyme A synthetase/AMP-(fatty) acid ligase
MRHSDEGALFASLSTAGNLSDRVLWGAEASIALGDLVRGSSLGGRLEELRGRSVLVATDDQLTAALALIELDGVARRIVLAPPDLPVEDIPFVVAAAAVEALVSDRAAPDAGMSRVGTFVRCSPRLAPGAAARSASHQTEWVLLTSGTTGAPKLVVHTLSTLAGALRRSGTLAPSQVWSTFYDIRRYGGLQILLRALVGGGSLVLSSARESTGDFLIRAGGHRVTHISGTPSHWRRALMSPSANRIAPEYVRLSGEIADQAILDHLRAFYPAARITHAFASTEGGVAFAVGDGLAGFPASLTGQRDAAVELKIEGGTLRIRSARTALRYLGNREERLADPEGFVDTGDMVELRGDRYHFVGRRGGIINVGGLKVHPEEVEAVINGHPKVQMSRVRARQNALLGALVVADVVLTPGADAANGRLAGLEHEILQRCRDALPPHKVPAVITFVPALDVAATGKLVRHDA